MNTSPFHRTTDGRWPEPYIDAVALAQALAPHFKGAAFEPDSDVDVSPQFRVGKLRIGDARVTFRTETGSRASKVTAYVYPNRELEQKWKLYTGGYPTTYKTSFDPSRPLEAIAQQVQRSALDKAAPAIMSMVERVEQGQEKARVLHQHIEAMRAKYPMLRIDMDEDRNAANFSNTDPYMQGRINADGGLYFSRLGLLSADTSAAILAVLFSKKGA